MCVRVNFVDVDVCRCKLALGRFSRLQVLCEYVLKLWSFRISMDAFMHV